MAVYRRIAVAVAVVLAVGLFPYAHPPDPAAADPIVPLIAVDTVSGPENTANSFSSVNYCRAMSVGQTATFDVVVRLPEGETSSGASFDVMYDPTLMHITTFAGNIKYGAGAFTTFSDTVPDTDGDFRAEIALFSNFVGGDGVAARFTVVADSPGISLLTLDDRIEGDGVPNILAADSSIFSIDRNVGAALAIGVPCQPPNAPIIPPGNAGIVALDAEVAGNSSSMMGPIDSCIEIALNETVPIDLVTGLISSPSSLAGVSAVVGYDPEILRVDAIDANYLMPPTVSFSDSMPDSDGQLLIDEADLEAPYSAGTGTLVRIQFTGVAAGITLLTLNDITGSGFPSLISPDGLDLPLIEAREAMVAVDVPCQWPTDAVVGEGGSVSAPVVAAAGSAFTAVAGGQTWTWGPNATVADITISPVIPSDCSGGQVTIQDVLLEPGLLYTIPDTPLQVTCTGVGLKQVGALIAVVASDPTTFELHPENNTSNAIPDVVEVRASANVSLTSLTLSPSAFTVVAGVPFPVTTAEVLENLGPYEPAPASHSLSISGCSATPVAPYTAALSLTAVPTSELVIWNVNCGSPGTVNLIASGSLTMASTYITDPVSSNNVQTDSVGIVVLADGDHDTIPDTTDNCLNVANTNQVNTDGDPWGDACDNCPLFATLWQVPAGDSDCDGITDSRETFMGTDQADRCADTTTLDDERGPAFGEPVPPWPPDINDNGAVNLSDAVRYGPVFNSPPNPNYNARFDINADGRISLADVVLFGPFFNKSCTP